jgi:hypothetical protein
VPNAQGKHAEQRSPAAEVISILAVEAAGVTLGVPRGRIRFRVARAATALTTPAQDRTVGREPVAVIEHPTAHHPLGRTRGDAGANDIRRVA